MNGKTPMISTAPPFVLSRLSKDERRVFQRNRKQGLSLICRTDGTWYSGVTVNDIPELVEQRLLGGKVVERFACTRRIAENRATSLAKKQA